MKTNLEPWKTMKTKWNYENHENQPVTMKNNENQPGTKKNHENQLGTMKNHENQVEL